MTKNPFENNSQPALEIKDLYDLCILFTTQNRTVDFLGTTITVPEGILDPVISKSTGILATETEKLISPETENILELGTGSGAVAIYLAKQFPNLQIDASDILPEAVECTRRNTEINSLTNITVFESDGYQSLPENKKYDVIFCSPPASQTNFYNPLEGENNRAFIFSFDFKGVFIKQIFEHIKYRLNPAGKLILYCNSNTNFELLKVLSEKQELILEQKLVAQGRETTYPVDSFIQIYTFK